jgi:transcriptional regulator with XRE-family HTH domain
MDIKQQIKEILLKEKMTMTDLVELINKNKMDESSKTTVSNLNNKLTRGTIRYSEIIEIFDVLDYDITPKKRTRANNTFSIMEYLDIPDDLKDKIKSFPETTKITATLFDSPNKYKYGAITGSKNDTTTIKHEAYLTEKESLEMRLLFEMSINWEISELINKLIEYYLSSNYVLDDKIEKVFKNYLDDDDILAVNTRLEKYCLPLLYLLNQYPVEGEILPFLTHVRNIYASGGLALLSDDELNHLMDSVNYYNEHDFIEK